jgi:hypothetical protein
MPLRSFLPTGICYNQIVTLSSLCSVSSMIAFHTQFGPTAKAVGNSINFNIVWYKKTACPIYFGRLL